MSGDYGSDPGLPRSVVIERGGMRLTTRLLFGLVLVTLGVLWTLDNLGVPGIGEALRWWPAFLIAYGLMRITGIDGTRRIGSGMIFTLIGAWLLARGLGWVHVSIWNLWPMWMILVGGSLVWRSLRGPGVDDGGIDRGAYPRPFAFMGGTQRRVESQEFLGLEATAVMGGIEADLTGARPRGNAVVAEVFAWWGGIELIVPEDWRVSTEVTPIMGGVEDTSRFAGGEAATTLVVRGLVIMGGVEIKNEKRRRESRGEFRGVKVGMSDFKVGVTHVGRRSRKEVRITPTGVTITHEPAQAPPPSEAPPPPPTPGS